MDKFSSGSQILWSGGLAYVGRVAPPTQPAALVAPNGERLLTTKEAAALLGLSPRTLEGLRSRGAGPPFKVLSRNAVRYQADELRAWIQSRSAAHTAQVLEFPVRRPHVR